jgi:hypothetical protein
VPEFPAYQRPREVRTSALGISALATFDTQVPVEFAATWFGVRFAIGSAVTGQAWISNVLRNGATVFGALAGPAIPIGQKGSGVVQLPSGIVLLAPGDVMQFSVEQLGTNTPADLSWDLLVIP